MKSGLKLLVIGLIFTLILSQGMQIFMDGKTPEELEELEGVFFFLGIGLALCLAKLFGEAFERMGQPGIIGEILVGLLIGTQLLGPTLHIDITNEIFEHFSEIGIMLLLFLTGLEVDLKKLQETGKIALFVAMCGAILPFAGGYAIGMWKFGDSNIAMLLGAILTATSVGVTARILVEAKAIDTKAGSTILGAAIIDDILGILVIIITSSIAEQGSIDIMQIGMLFLGMAFFFLVTVVLGLKYINRITETFEKLETEKAFITLCLAMAFFFGVFAELAGGIAAITGAFIAGMIIGETPYRHRVEGDVKTIGYGFFIPLFFVSVGTWIEFEAFGSALGLMAILIVIAMIGKFIGCGLPAKLMGCSTREATIVGVGMIPRLELGLVVAAIGINAGMAGDPTAALATEVSALAVVISIVTGIIPLFFLKPLINKYLETEVNTA